MLGLSGLGQSALAALPGEAQPTPVAVFRNLSWHQPYATIGIRLHAHDGSVVRTGVKSYCVVPCDCNIVGMLLLADQPGSIVIDIYREPLAQFPPTQHGSITFDHKPTLSNAQNIIDQALIDWETALRKGDTLGFEVLSCSLITSVTLALIVDRAG